MIIDRRFLPPAANRRPPSLEPDPRSLADMTVEERLDYAEAAVCFAEKVLEDVLSLPLKEHRTRVEAVRRLVRGAKDLARR